MQCLKRCTVPLRDPIGNNYVTLAFLFYVLTTYLPNWLVLFNLIVCVPEAYSKPCQPSMIELSLNIFNFQPFQIFTEHSILHV